MQFKPGDKIVCIDDCFDTHNQRNELFKRDMGGLTAGTEYTVQESSPRPGRIILAEIDRGPFEIGFYEDRFRPA